MPRARANKQPVVVHLAGEMTIYNAAAFKSTLADALQQKGDIELDLSQLAELDSAGVQLLLLAKREATQYDKALRLVGHSPAVLDVFETFNLAPHFGDPIVLFDKLAVR